MSMYNMTHPSFSVYVCSALSVLDDRPEGALAMFVKQHLELFDTEQEGGGSGDETRSPGLLLSCVLQPTTKAFVRQQLVKGAHSLLKGLASAVERYSQVLGQRSFFLLT